MHECRYAEDQEWLHALPFEQLARVLSRLGRQEDGEEVGEEEEEEGHQQGAGADDEEEGEEEKEEEEEEDMPWGPLPPLMPPPPLQPLRLPPVGVYESGHLPPLVLPPIPGLAEGGLGASAAAAGAAGEEGGDHPNPRIQSLLERMATAPLTQLSQPNHVAAQQPTLPRRSDRLLHTASGEKRSRPCLATASTRPQPPPPQQGDGALRPGAPSAAAMSPLGSGPLLLPSPSHQLGGK